MMKITADTNVLVRAFTVDYAEQSKAAQIALSKADLIAQKPDWPSWMQAVILLTASLPMRETGLARIPSCDSTRRP